MIYVTAVITHITLGPFLKLTIHLNSNSDTLSSSQALHIVIKFTTFENKEVRPESQVSKLWMIINYDIYLAMEHVTKYKFNFKS